MGRAHIQPTVYSEVVLSLDILCLIYVSETKLRVGFIADEHERVLNFDLYKSMFTDKY